MEEIELKIEKIEINRLIPYINNAKRHPDEQIEQIVYSIEQFGMCDPIGVWHNEKGEIEIVEGHGRVLALQRMGKKTAPVIFLDHLTDEERRVYTHAHNQLTLNSDMERDVLIEDMDNLNADWEALGFSEFMPDFLDESGDIQDESLPDTVECRCKPGDVWVLGAHKIKCGSATSADDISDLLGGGVSV